jgi:hypothetical protein
LFLKGISSEFIRLLKEKAYRKTIFRKRQQLFKKKWTDIRMRAFIIESSSIKKRKDNFNRLFVNKLCPFLKYKVSEDFFTRIKNYSNSKDNSKLLDRTNRIQRVIETFEKKRKSILNVNLRKWRRNQY